MINVDYKIFVPRGAANYIRIRDKEFLIDEIMTVNIHLTDDKVTYWINFRIGSEEDKDTNVILKKKSISDMVLLIGNNPYEIYGQAEVQYNTANKWEEKRAITVQFVVMNASNTYNNPKKEIPVERADLLDFED